MAFFPLFLAIVLAGFGALALFTTAARGGGSRQRKPLMETTPSVMPAYVAGIVRALLSAVGGTLVSKGLLDQGMSEALAGACLVVVTAVWSIIQKRNAHAAIAGR